MQILPIGKQTFADIRHDNMLYVDKTAYIHRMITRGSAYFLSRPRRFGKSLTLSTLDAIFSGKRDLFDGLAIAKTDYRWDRFPIIRMDMSQLDFSSVDTLKHTLILTLEKIATAYGLILDPRGGIQLAFASLIENIFAKHGKVVVLIDEYDKPISEHLTNIPLAIAIRDTLSDFYTILKSSDAYLRFVLLTGVSKFTKAGVFSKLNHLDDITMVPDYAALCGYTQEELEYYFREYIEVLAHPPTPSQEGDFFSERAAALSIPFKDHVQGATSLSTPLQDRIQGTTAGSPLNENFPPPGRGPVVGSSPTEQVLDKIKTWYNGYRFSTANVRVYNPFSTLLLFQHRVFKNYWFETGTPNLLINLIKQTHYDLENIEKTPVMESAFSTYELENLDLAALLFQTGYLTIDSYQPERLLYQLKFPNLEVHNSFFDYLLRAYTKDSTFSGSPMWTLVDALNANDLPLFFETLNLFFAKIPYDIQLGHERYYQTIFYIIFTLIGLKISAEVRTNTGRIDAIVETADTLFLFEFKVDDTAEKALTQIDTKGYAFPFSDSPKTLQKIGVSFSKKERNITEWLTGASV